MPSLEEIVEAVWAEVINGATAEEILAAWLRYMDHQGASHGRPGGGFLSTVRWFYSNWLPQPAEALPQTPVKVVRGRIVPATGRTGALRAPTSRHRPPPEERPFQMGGVRSGIATAIAPPRVAPGRQGREHTAIDEDIEALLAALLMLDED